jgi:hypothetical protein
MDVLTLALWAFAGEVTAAKTRPKTAKEVFNVESNFMSFFLDSVNLTMAQGAEESKISGACDWETHQTLFTAQ